MGFADVSIAALAEDYGLNIAQVFTLCRQFEIPFQNEHSQLALEDAKRIILEVRHPPQVELTEEPRS
ncbi:MAG: hypothetical protein KME03_13880 [Aphanocapsa lilacina HA4352-LM1]|nr:hypothetical protein [Aphanocapsa lilacina HA4352-LM1]